MPRPRRKTVQGLAYHVLNRRVMRLPLFEKPADYAAFEQVLALGQERPDALEILGWCLMPNHWHLVLWPRPRSNLSTWMQWLSVTHTHRWHQHHHSVGEGPLYQGRFKSFPIQADEHLLTVLRYVEANPLRAGLVRRAERWTWSSLSIRVHGAQEDRPKLARGPVDLPDDWVDVVNARQDGAELERVRTSVQRGGPLGQERWVKRMVAALGLEATQRPRGRPKLSG